MRNASCSMSPKRRTSGRKRKRPARYGLDDDADEVVEVVERERVLESRPSLAGGVAGGVIRLFTPVVENEPDEPNETTRRSERDSIAARDAETQTDDDGVARRLESERDFLRRELRDALFRETSHCAALASSERARAESEREIARLVLKLASQRGQ